MLKKLQRRLTALIAAALVFTLFCAVNVRPERASAEGTERDWNEYVLENGTSPKDFYKPSYSVPATVYNWYTMDESDKLPRYFENRDFTAIPSIAVTGDRWWCVWMIGGDCEPHIDNCLVLAYSDDCGLTWVDPVLIIDHAPDVDENIRISDPVLTYEDDRLFLFWAQNYITQTNYQCTWRTEILNYNGEKENVTATAPVFCCYGVFWKMTVLHDGVWAAGIQCHAVKWALGFYVVSYDYGATWKFRGYADKPAQYSAHNEVSIVERSDGTLWMIKRIQWQSKQGVEESYSYDGGFTWTDFAFTEYPLKGPGSKFNFIYTKSGNLVFINHDTIEDRKLLTAFISKDEGVTWESSKLLLDERMGVSYPMVDLDKDGNIVVVYDMGRETNREIRIARFNEADIFAGRVITEGNYIKGLVSIGSDNIDLVSADEEYKETERYVGTSVAALRADFPTTIHVSDYYGEKHEFVGVWDFSKVDLKTPGVYEAVFKPSAGLPENVVDVRKILTATVVVKEVEDVAIASVEGITDFTFEVGTPISEIRENLPEKLVLTDEKGDEYEVYGYWTSETYEDKAGEYGFKFNVVSELPSYIVDVDNSLSANVKITAKQTGCTSAIAPFGWLTFTPLAVIVFIRKRRERR